MESLSEEDLIKQAIMEEELAIGVKDARAKWGVAIAMEPSTGAILGMAAHMEGRGVSVLDVAGLAQKNGTAYTHLRIADDPARHSTLREERT